MHGRVLASILGLAVAGCSGGSPSAPAPPPPPACTTTCPAGGVVVTVLGPGGAPVAGATVSIAGPSCSPGACTCEAATGADGQARCTAPVGSYSAAAAAPGLVSAPVSLSVLAGPAPCACPGTESATVRLQPDLCLGVSADDGSPCTVDRCEPLTGALSHSYSPGCGGPATAPWAPTSGKTLDLDGVAYQSWEEPGQGLRLLCSHPCPLADAVGRALEGGMLRAREVLVGLAGLDVLPSLRPVDVHVNGGGPCGAFSTSVAGFATLTADSRGRLCLFSAEWAEAPHPYLPVPLTVDSAGRLENLTLFVHEYGHLLFFGRHEISWESLVRALSYHVSGQILDPCDASLESYGAPLPYQLCQQIGFGYRHLAPALQALEDLYQAGAGEVDPAVAMLPSGPPPTSVRQLRLALEAQLGKDTLPPFLAAAELPFVRLGDAFTLRPEGGATGLYRGRVTLALPPGAVAAPVEVVVTPVYRLQGVDLAWASLAFASAMRLEPAATALSPAATLTLPYDPAAVPAGGDAGALRIHWAPGPGVAGSPLPSTVDPVAHTVSAPLPGLGVVYPAP